MSSKINPLAVAVADGWADAIEEAVEAGILTREQAMEIAINAADYSADLADEAGVGEELNALALEQLGADGEEEAGGCGCGATIDLDGFVNEGGALAR